MTQILGDVQCATFPQVSVISMHCVDGLACENAGFNNAVAN